MMIKKKILFVLGHLQYSDGVAKVLVDICNNLNPEKYDITVVSLFRFDKDFIKMFNSNIKTKTLFGFYFRGMSKIINIIPQQFLYRRIVGKTKYNLEIGFQFGLSTRIIAASTNKNVPHVAWMHTYDEGLSLIESYKKMDKVVCVSKCNADRLVEESNGRVNATYCYNLVDDIALKTLAQETVSIMSQYKPLLVSVGRQSPEKGYGRLISILGQIKKDGKEFECWLIGDGPEHEMLKAMIKENNLEDYVILLGAQKNPHKYTSKADVFICSSFSEGYSTACTEAAVLGIPIITTCVSGGEEIIADANCGMLTQLDDESLKTAIETIIVDHELLNEWKNTAKITAKNFYKVTRIDHMRDVFEELCFLNDEKAGRE